MTDTSPPTGAPLTDRKKCLAKIIIGELHFLQPFIWAPYNRRKAAIVLRGVDCGSPHSRDGFRELTELYMRVRGLARVGLVAGVG